MGKLTRKQKYDELRKTLDEDPRPISKNKIIENIATEEKSNSKKTRKQKYDELRALLDNVFELKNYVSYDKVLENKLDQIEEEIKKLGVYSNTVEDLETEQKRAYNKRTLVNHGKLQKINSFNNALLEDNRTFNIKPITITEKDNIEIKVSSKENESFNLTENDKKIDTLIANLIEYSQNELKDKDYIDRTLLNIVNEFYNPVTSQHYTEKQLKEVFELLVKNMTPLVFKYDNGEQVITPLINIQMRKEKPNATTTIRIFKDQYITEYNKKVKGKRVVIYKLNLKDDLKQQYTLKNSELAEIIEKRYLNKKINKFYFKDFTMFFNEDNRTEKNNFKKKLITMLKGYSNYYQITDPKEIRKNPKQSNSEIIGLSIKYKNAEKTSF